MTNKIMYTLLLVLISVLFYTANGQVIKSSGQGINNRLQNDVLGISFAKVGTVTQIDNSTYYISMSSSNTSPGESAYAQVSEASRLFVDLPGSYGGRMYLDSPTANKSLQNRVLVDSVNNGQLNFHRGYWAVYAGMGMWDCVINCSLQKNGRYYIVSLVQEKMMGKPGETIDGKQLKAEDLKSKVVSSLQDTTNSTISKFNKLLYSFQINK